MSDCACGHGWEYHGPELPGCAECRCRRLPTDKPTQEDDK